MQRAEAGGGKQLSPGSRMVAGRIALMREGKIIAADSPAGLKKTLFPTAVFEFDPKEALSFSEIINEPLVLMTPESSQGARAWLFDHFKQAGGTPRVALETPNFENLLFLVETGKGITVLSRHIVEFYSNFHVRCIDMVGKDVQCSAVALWEKALENPAAAHFLTELGVQGLYKACIN